METRKTILKATTTLFVSITLALAVSVSGCTSAAKRGAPEVPGATTEQPKGDDTSSGEVYGPGEPTQPVYGPEPPKIRPIVLVLGPGLARGFAYAGVLRALDDAKIPVGAVVGTEMGGLIGGIYSLSESVNAFEWSLLKIKEDFFTGKNLLSVLLKKTNDGKQLLTVLESELGERDLVQARVSFLLGLRMELSRETIFVDRGRAARALRSAVALPGFMAASEWTHGPADSAGIEKPFPIAEAKRFASGPVVVIDVISDAQQFQRSAKTPVERQIVSLMVTARKNGLPELKDADLVIRPKLNGITFLDFNKRTDAVFQGKVAVQENLQRLRELTGLAGEAAQ